MSLRKLRRDYLAADISAVSSLLSNLSEEDAMARFSLTDRLHELKMQIGQLESEAEPTAAAAALFFGGRPVVASRGIDSEFGANALTIFQDLVSKVHANDAGFLGQRGVVPNKASAALHVTDIVRGSFGFLLEELDTQSSIVDSSLASAVQHATDVLDAFGADDEERFRSAIEDLDERVLVTAKSFFGLMRDRGATLRIVSGSTDHIFVDGTVARAAERATSTTVKVTEERVSGVLAGVLPDSHQFELRRSPNDIVKGRIDRSFTADVIEGFNKTWVGKQCAVRLNVRRILKDGDVVRQSFTFLEIAAEIDNLAP